MEKNLKAKVTIFLNHTNVAELKIIKNSSLGYITPDSCDDGGDPDFTSAYAQIRPELTLFTQERLIIPPPNTKYCSTPFFEECIVKAWMRMLNPADRAFGEPGFLQSKEYQNVKNAAIKILARISDPPLNHFLSDTQLRILSVLKDNPQSSKVIAQLADCENQTARKYLPKLFKLGLISQAPNKGYYKSISINRNQ